VVGRNGLMCRFARGWLSYLKATTYGEMSDLKASTYGEVSDRDGRDAGDAICRSAPSGPTPIIRGSDNPLVSDHSCFEWMKR
jgi:hypothetical protein